MGIVDRIVQQSLIAAPHIVARYRAVMWEPLASTGERIVALLCVEPSPECTDELRPGTYPVLKPERLRALFGRQRGDAAAGVMAECAQYMSSAQATGVPIEELRPLFRGFALGPVHQARAYSVSQLLDAAVRTVSAVASADDMLIEAETDRPDQTRRTAEFLRQVRRAYAAGDDDLQRRFRVRLQREQSAPEVWVDYADGPVVLQVASIPATPNQAHPAEAELKSKLLDLEVVRAEFDGNHIIPTLLLNTRALEEPVNNAGLEVARSAHAQFLRYAEWAKLRVLQVATPAAAVHALDELSGGRR